ncbi:AAA-domain-containing protein [Lentithecium fluviatile CBS 122367]|uniref:AAA-domain-containing protein n=1 Tax=Lentithecium fluviatile CBS 122367 TaxID=1168545 RepID=A0A6G1JGE8_9PLEO|nr:AAA-domain-containing protein [Lentithecium fluviatile CBS 122367]
MYAAIRPALRASRRSPARTVRGRRYPSPQRTRSFHTTRRLAQDPTPPAGAESRPSGSNGGEKQGEKSAAAQTDAGVAAEDAEDLAQKLQHSREMTRRYSSALRRSQRRGRAQDLPPVVIPDWFLRRNVFCREEVPNDAPRRGEKKTITLSLQRRDSDETSTCTIPLSRPSAGVKVLNQFLRGTWDRHLNVAQKRRFARQLASTLGAADDERVVQALEQGEDPYAENVDLHSLLGPILLGKQKLEDQTADVPVLRDHRLAEKVAEWQGKIGEVASSIQEQCEALARNRNPGNQVLPFVLAEVRATVAASLSALQPATNDSFPSAKTNLILHCPSDGQDRLMTRTVMSVASELGAEVVVLHAQDLAEIGGDYLSEGSEPSPHSIRSMGYETYRANSQSGDDIDDYSDPQADDQDEAPAPSLPTRPGYPAPSILMPGMFFHTALQKSLVDRLAKFKSQLSASEAAPSSNEPQQRVQTQGESQLEDLKLANLLESLVDSTEAKRTHRHIKPKRIAEATSALETKAPNSPPPAFFNAAVPPIGDQIDLVSALPLRAASKYSLSVNVQMYLKKPLNLPKSKIIYIKDFKELDATQYGGRVIQKLEEIVRKRRSAGESIMIVGSTCSEELTPELSARGFQGLQSEDEADFYRTIVVPVESAVTLHDSDIHSVSDTKSKHLALKHASSITASEKRKYQSINLRHIQHMLRCLDPIASQYISDREKGLDDLRTSAMIFPESNLWKVLSYDEVHRIALTALGLHLMDTASGYLKWTHVALAMSLLKVSDAAKAAYANLKVEEQKSSRLGEGWQKRMQERMNEAGTRQSGPEAASRRARERQLENLSLTASKHEKRLMPGIANPDQIKTTFDQVHVPPETVDSIRTLTSMSFLRPDAFSYGVLATEKISGALLYGPPGTGKTMLAKAVAKESGCAVLEVSGSSIMDKYVGEGEKNVTAIFSLARKLSPCIVFLDEADAIFSSRDVGRERSSHRDILNQFLKEWDGLNDLSVFVMVATNRPFDLDDAVIRRLPRRLLVDLPTQKDRHEILKIHLRGEQLDGSVDLEDLAKRTPFYSGSDLKNLAVSAALACVKEENEQAVVAAAKLAVSATETSPTPLADMKSAHLSRDQKYEFPEIRVLHARHFDRALQEISASISEDMSSLNAIKKFDEKYGDKKGKKKKRVFGIGLHPETNESAARVRP